MSVNLFIYHLLYLCRCSYFKLHIQTPIYREQQRQLSNKSNLHDLFFFFYFPNVCYMFAIELTNSLAFCLLKQVVVVFFFLFFVVSLVHIYADFVCNTYIIYINFRAECELSLLPKLQMHLCVCTCN